MTQEVTQFSVTVPTVLPVDVSATGVITVANDNKIINNSFGPVEVKSVSVESLKDWTLVDFNTDFKTKKVGLHEYGFQMNKANVEPTGSCAAVFDVIPGNGQINFVYDSKVATQNMALNKENIANVVFTVGWSGESSIPLQGISINKPTVTLEKGKQDTLEVVFDPPNATNPGEVVWESNNTCVSVNNGLITANDWGTAIVTATVGDKVASCTVTVPKVVTGVSLDQESIQLKVGETYQLSAISSYRGAYLWKSLNDGVAKVTQDGLVTAMAPGSTTISVSDEGFSDTCIIKVTTNKPDKAKMDAALKNLTGKITFTTTAYSGSDGIDISENGDRSVIAVVSGQDATVYADGGVLGVDTGSDGIGMFEKYRMKAIDLAGLDMSQMTNVRFMFHYCTSLTTLNLSGMNMSQVTNAFCMFNHCTSLTTINLSGVNMSQVTNANTMFANCGSLATLDLSSVNMSQVTNTQSMFTDCGSLATLDLSSVNMSQVTNTSYMFYNCIALKTCYAKTQQDCDKLNSSSYKPANVKFVVKPAA